MSVLDGSGFPLEQIIQPISITKPVITWLNGKVEPMVRNQEVLFKHFTAGRMVNKDLQMPVKGQKGVKTLLIAHFESRPLSQLPPPLDMEGGVGWEQQGQAGENCLHPVPNYSHIWHADAPMYNGAQKKCKQFKDVLLKLTRNASLFPS